MNNTIINNTTNINIKKFYFTNKENGKNNNINKFKYNKKNILNRKTYILIDCKIPFCLINKFS